MPDNDVVFDYHEHHDPDHHLCTHEHDNHPRHHHDKHGSVHYYPYPGVVDIHNYDDGRTDASALIGESGFDITHRTRTS